MDASDGGAADRPVGVGASLTMPFSPLQAPNKRIEPTLSGAGRFARRSMRAQVTRITVRPSEERIPWFAQAIGVLPL